MCANNKDCNCQVTVTACAVVEVLNRALKADPGAINELFDYRVPCNEALTDDPTVQVRSGHGLAGQKGTVGVLGLINGLLGVDENGWGYVRAVYDNDQKQIVMFELSEKAFEQGETCCFEWCQAPATVTVRNRDNEDYKACEDHAEVVRFSGGLKSL